MIPTCTACRAACRYSTCRANCQRLHVHDVVDSGERFLEVMLDELNAAALDLLTADRSALLVLLTCAVNSPACDPGVVHRASSAVMLASQGLAGRVNATIAGADAFPVAPFGLAAEDLPALVLLTSSSRYVTTLASLGSPGHHYDAADVIGRSRMISQFVHRSLGGVFTAHVRSAPLPLRAAWSHRPIVSTALSLTSDLAAAGNCALLLVHDSSATASSAKQQRVPAHGRMLQQERPQQKQSVVAMWSTLSLQLFELRVRANAAASAAAAAFGVASSSLSSPGASPAPPAPPAPPLLLQLDLASNDLPHEPALAAELSRVLHETGVPSLIQVVPRAAPAPTTPEAHGASPHPSGHTAPGRLQINISGTPLRRARSAAALLQWARSHARGCQRPERASTAHVPGETAAELSAAVASSEQGSVDRGFLATADARSMRWRWLEEFAGGGATSIAVGMHDQLRQRLRLQYRRQLDVIGEEHARLSDGRARQGSMDADAEWEAGTSDVSATRMLVMERMRKNDRELRALLDQAARALVSNGAAGSAAEGAEEAGTMALTAATDPSQQMRWLLRNASCRLELARALNDDLEWRRTARLW